MDPTYLIFSTLIKFLRVTNLIFQTGKVMMKENDILDDRFLVPRTPSVYDIGE